MNFDDFIVFYRTPNEPGHYSVGLPFYVNDLLLYLLLVN